MRGALFDSSVYISGMRRGDSAVLALRRFSVDAPLWLSAVVLEGRVLARLAARYGYEKIGQGRLANDALIAMSAARMGMTVITANERDFARLAEFRSFQWELSVL